ncbi:MAG TPA: rhodanese-like domain-containing protein [Terriglobales bacterium]|nr:rhodanese-like domain-containing protein [Terriglobales bacterium]
MKLRAIAGIAVFYLVSASLATLPQQHPSVTSGAPEVSASELHSMLGQQGKVLVLDVRTPEEYAKGHIPEAVNVPIDSLAAKVQEMHVSKETTIVTTCEHGGRSSRAALELRKMGYQDTSFCRIASWQKNGYKIEKGDAGPRSK